jgi:hypothetical protein
MRTHRVHRLLLTPWRPAWAVYAARLLYSQRLCAAAVISDRRLPIVEPLPDYSVPPRPSPLNVWLLQSIRQQISIDACSAHHAPAACIAPARAA